MDTHDTVEVTKVLENKCRRAAKRQGLVLVKNRRRDKRAPDFGKFGLSDASGTPMFGYAEYGYDNPQGIGPTATLKATHAVLSYGFSDLYAHWTAHGDGRDEDAKLPKGDTMFLPGYDYSFDLWCEVHADEILKAAGVN